MAKIVLNGESVDEKDAAIPVADYGLIYGYGLFETMRAYNGKIFKLERHLKRLSDGAGVLGMDLSGIDFKGQIQKALDSNDLSTADAYVRLTVTYGQAGPRLAFNDCDPNVFIIATPLDAKRIDEFQLDGVDVIVSDQYVREQHSPLTSLKSLNHLPCVLAKREAKEEGVFDVIMLNTEGYVAEASTANVFIVKDGVLKTPPIDAGILPGITREVVIEIAGELGVWCGEEHITLQDLSSADEVFLTNSTGEVMPVVKVGLTTISGGRPGRITGKILDAYQQGVTC